MRKIRLSECDPQWVSYSSMGAVDGIRFDCPEGHEDCVHVIPFTPALHIFIRDGQIEFCGDSK